MPGSLLWPGCSNSLNQDDKQAHRSMDRLSELGSVTVLPGHGKPWKGSMKEAVEGARRFGEK
jgi:hypothetical protein